MSIKWKAFLSIGVFALSFFMLIETQYLPPLGDLLLESVGLKAWSDGDIGFHIAILYFGFVAVISYIFMKRFAYVQMKMKGITIFLIIIVLLTAFTYATSATAQYIKTNSDGLYAVALVSNDKSRTLNLYSSGKNDSEPIYNKAHYNTRDFKVTDFEIDLTLKNYAKNEVTFYIEFEPFMLDGEPLENIKIWNKDGSKAAFTLAPGMTHRFVITEDVYQLTGGMRGENSGYGLNVSEIILTNDQGESILLKDSSIIAE